MSWAGDELVKPFSGKESERGRGVFNVISIYNISIKYLLRSFCSVKQ